MKLAGLVILGSFAVTATAQSGAAGFFNPLSTSRDGIHLYGVSVYTGYFSGGIPFEVSSINTLPNVRRHRSYRRFGQLRMESDPRWVEPDDLGDASVHGLPRAHVAANHGVFAGLESNHQSWGRNGLSTSAAAGHVTDLEQSYFAANSFGLAASLPTTFDALSGAILNGKFTDAQLASALTGASAPLSPEQAYLYGQRVASASLTAGISYAASGTEFAFTPAWRRPACRA